MNNTKYYILNQIDQAIDITDDDNFQQYRIKQEDITEHLKAQLQFIKEGHPKHLIQPVIIGVTAEIFENLLKHLCTTYRGFKYHYFVNRNLIPIRLQPQGADVIRIINSELLIND